MAEKKKKPTKKFSKNAVIKAFEGVDQTILTIILKDDAYYDVDEAKLALETWKNRKVGV